MPKSVYFTTGKNSVGKTTFIETAVQWDSRHLALYPGKRCREKFGEETFAKSDQPEAPDFSEKFVRELVHEAVDELIKEDNKDTLYVDGFPRRIDQVEVTQQVAERVDTVTLYYCVCEEQERKRRQKLRSDKAQLLAAARDKTEPEAMLKVIEACALRGIPLVDLDLTQNVLQTKAMHPLKGHLLMIGGWLKRLVAACNKITLKYGNVTHIINCHASDHDFEEKWIKSEFENESNILHVAKLEDHHKPNLIAPIFSIGYELREPDEVTAKLWALDGFDRLKMGATGPEAGQGTIVARLTAAEWIYIDQHFASELSTIVVGFLKSMLPDVFKDVQPRCSNIKIVRYEGKVR